MNPAWKRFSVSDFKEGESHMARGEFTYTVRIEKHWSMEYILKNNALIAMEYMEEGSCET